MYNKLRTDVFKRSNKWITEKWWTIRFVHESRAINSTRSARELVQRPHGRMRTTDRYDCINTDVSLDNYFNLFPHLTSARVHAMAELKREQLTVLHICEVKSLMISTVAMCRGRTSHVRVTPTIVRNGSMATNQRYVLSSFFHFPCEFQSGIDSNCYSVPHNRPIAGFLFKPEFTIKQYLLIKNLFMFYSTLMSRSLVCVGLNKPHDPIHKHTFHTHTHCIIKYTKILFDSGTFDFRHYKWICILTLIPIANHKHHRPNESIEYSVR